MSEEEMKALVEMKDMLKVENTKLKQENNELNKQLATYKQKEDKLRELIEAPIDNMSLNWQSKLILQILNEGDKQ